MLLPRGLVFAFGGGELLADGERREIEEADEAYRAAGRWIEQLLRANRSEIDRLANWLTASCAFLACEVVLWTVGVAG